MWSRCVGFGILIAVSFVCSADDVEKTRQPIQTCREILSSLKDARPGMTVEEILLLRPRAKRNVDFNETDDPHDPTFQDGNLVEFEMFGPSDAARDGYFAFYTVKHRRLETVLISFSGDSRKTESLVPLFLAWCEGKYGNDYATHISAVDGLEKGKVLCPTLVWEKEGLVVCLRLDRHEVKEGHQSAVNLSIQRKSKDSIAAKLLPDNKVDDSEKKELYHTWGLDKILEREAERKRKEQ
jgi:hypothetical protein